MRYQRITHVMLYHCLERKSAIVQPLSCEDKKFFHVVEKYLMQPEESETPIYNMALELENINLYELTLEIKRKSGTVLDLNTACVVCEFEKFPFKLDDENNIRGYYHDQKHLVPKYELEEGTSRVKRSKLQRYLRTDKYRYEDCKCCLMSDPGHNVF